MGDRARESFLNGKDSVWVWPRIRDRQRPEFGLCFSLCPGFRASVWVWPRIKARHG